MAPPVGLEPTTLRLTAACSNQLGQGGIFTKFGVPTLHKALYSTTRARLPMPGTLLDTTKISYFILHIYYNIFFIKNQRRFLVKKKES